MLCDVEEQATRMPMSPSCLSNNGPFNVIRYLYDVCLGAIIFKRTGGTNQSSVVRKQYILEFAGCLVHIVNIN